MNRIIYSHGMYTRYSDCSYCGMDSYNVIKTNVQLLATCMTILVMVSLFTIQISGSAGSSHRQPQSGPLSSHLHGVVG